MRQVAWQAWISQGVEMGGVVYVKVCVVKGV